MEEATADIGAAKSRLLMSRQIDLHLLFSSSTSTSLPTCSTRYTASCLFPSRAAHEPDADPEHRRRDGIVTLISVQKQVKGAVSNVKSRRAKPTHGKYELRRVGDASLRCVCLRLESEAERCHLSTCQTKAPIFIVIFAVASRVESVHNVLR